MFPQQLLPQRHQALHVALGLLPIKAGLINGKYSIMSKGQTQSLEMFDHLGRPTEAASCLLLLLSR